MTFAERVQAVLGFGFTERQAAFLVTVALHSGYCLRRQYATFTGLHYGKNVRDFLDRLADREFARRFTYRGDSGHIYHLNARRLYRAIGQEDNRNRRQAGPALIARKLMLLDYVLKEPGRDWYATEQDKYDLFVGRLGVPSGVLPRRIYLGRREPPADRETTTRYCVQKLPVFIGPHSRVNFICLVTESSAREIVSFIAEHRTLLRELPEWLLVVTGPSQIAPDAQCADQFARAIGARQAVTPLTNADLTWLFQMRKTIEAGALSSVSVTDIQRYRKTRGAWNGELNALYANWRRDGDVDAMSQPADNRNLQNGRLVVSWLPYSYRQLGSMPGVT